MFGANKISNVVENAIKSNNVVNVDEESAHKIIDMVNSLDDHDDVQEVFSNFDISEELLDKL